MFITFKVKYFDYVRWYYPLIFKDPLNWYAVTVQLNKGKLEYVAKPHEHLGHLY